MRPRPSAGELFAHPAVPLAAKLRILQVAFLGFSRLDAKIDDPSALRALQHAAS